MGIRELSNPGCPFLSLIDGLRSKETLKKCLREGAVVACDVVWAKAPNAYGNHASELAEALRTMRLKRLLIEKILIDEKKPIHSVIPACF